MTRGAFIRARLEDLSRTSHGPMEDFISSFVCAVLEILRLQEEWPVLVSHPPEPAVVYNQSSTENLILSMTSRINWLTQKEYLDRFGVEPRTSPVLDSIANIWSDHQDFNSEWAK